MTRDFPEQIPNWIAGRQVPAAAGQWGAKLSPHHGRRISEFASSTADDVATAVAAAKEAQADWAAIPAVKRGNILLDVALALRANAELVACIVAAETGKSPKEALGETIGAVQQGLFMAGEGMRLYGRTTTSAVANKHAMTVRCPIGVAGLIIAANTPIANVAWKVFPALICGNTAILKAPEDAPATAWIFGKIAAEAGLPRGVLNVVQGFGPEAGGALVAHPDVAVISFTGSTAVGRRIAGVAGDRLARLSLELGGKNAFVVCEDADLDKAVEWAVLSAFSNAGQRCAAGSRLIVFDAVYDEFRAKLIARTAKLNVGATDSDDCGPVINGRQLSNMLAAVGRAKAAGATVLCGGDRFTDEERAAGFYMQPTIVEGLAADAEMSICELFGPIAALYRVPGYAEAIALANSSPYGLTAAIHTRDFDRAMRFVAAMDTGVVTVNGGTYGSEPHMPFGGSKQSGNGSREPGTEALDVYSSLKDVYLLVSPHA
ncbi:aldehyde dehydrogenase family protein [Ferrovibrio sp.]|uniref:aldehyde dehydrogenase family protein n=1 Tax=Ferrovibrio sp. TaxID=1917215 RepID=UPI000CB48F1D|nr:aldehyde dehydrogenase family protein [Ferrovibrio sp.]PJI42525.1 MAG: aldehyde dehydrogenase [Ferrovibrio sp.]